MGKELELSGMKETIGNIKKLFRRFPREFKDQVKESTFNIDRNAKRFVAVDTNRLRSSARTEFSDGGLTGEVSFNTEYAGFVEEGTSKQDPQPYLGPAFRLEASRFEDKLIKRIIETIKGL